MLRAHDQPAAALGERDHRAVRSREGGRFSRDERREVIEGELSGGRESHVVERRHLFGAPPLELAEAPVGVEREARSYRQHKDGDRDRAVDEIRDRTGHPADIRVDKQERARRGDQARKQHSREMDRRRRHRRRGARLTLLDPLRPRDADGGHSEDPERIEERTGDKGR